MSDAQVDDLLDELDGILNAELKAKHTGLDRDPRCNRKQSTTSASAAADVDSDIDALLANFEAMPPAITAQLNSCHHGRPHLALSLTSKRSSSELSAGPLSFPRSDDDTMTGCAGSLSYVFLAAAHAGSVGRYGA